ncbi:hypothetical protein ACFQFH_09655 [Halobaculum halobium]|uniref:Uncharacterized protein n=1 Tax=Halobaculum halobium TaxID=3032281 RepID=A0ABD5TC33_9EURY
MSRRHTAGLAFAYGLLGVALFAFANALQIAALVLLGSVSTSLWAASSVSESPAGTTSAPGYQRYADRRLSETLGRGSRRLRRLVRK